MRPSYSGGAGAIRSTLERAGARAVAGYRFDPRTAVQGVHAPTAWTFTARFLRGSVAGTDLDDPTRGHHHRTLPRVAGRPEFIGGGRTVWNRVRQTEPARSRQHRDRAGGRASSNPASRSPGRPV